MAIDLLVRGNNIFDSVKKTPFKGYVCVDGNKISAVSQGDVPDTVLESAKKIIDAGDRLVTPGFHDNHVHLIMAGLFQVYVNLLSAKSEEEAVQMVVDAEKSHPSETDCIYGFCWYHVFWDNKVLPTKASLDKYFPDKPVFLLNWEAHGAWVNSKALEICGIDENTPDPFGGRIERDENGIPTGVLHEAATGLVTRIAMDFTPEQERNLIKAFMNYANAYGITSVTDVQPYFHGNMGSLDVYNDMDINNELSIRIHVAPDLLGDLDQAEQWRDKYYSDNIRVSHLKQFIDGVPTNHTGLLLDEYADLPGEYGICLNDLDSIEAAIPEAHRRGFSIKLHSCGDRSLQLGVNYYEKAIKMYGKNECRHAIEHCELADPEDIRRMGELGIVPSIQPDAIGMTEKFADNPYLETLGAERAGTTWAFKDMLNSTGVLALGSDCPVMDPNPFLQIYRGVTRLHNDGQPEGGWNPSQKLTLYDVLRGYTWGSAYAVARENELGTLEEGKFADIVILDRNLFTSPVDDWQSGKVDITIMSGNIVYERRPV